MYRPTKQDLLKLKDSKPVSITAHTHECIVPVVYAGMVGEFLKKKGIELPLTHHQLADFKREAHVSGYDKGYAKGTINLKDANLKNSKVTINIGEKKKKRKAKKKEKGEQKERERKSEPKIKQKISQKVYINLGKGDRGVGGGGDSDRPSRIPDQPIRPSNFALIRPHSYASNTPIQTDYNREFQETHKRQQEALDKYKKELETSRDVIKDLTERKEREKKDKEPIVIDMTTKPIRDNLDIKTPDEEKKEAEKIEDLVIGDKSSSDEEEEEEEESEEESEEEEEVKVKEKEKEKEEKVAPPPDIEKRETIPTTEGHIDTGFDYVPSKAGKKGVVLHIFTSSQGILKYKTDDSKEYKALSTYSVFKGKKGENKKMVDMQNFLRSRGFKVKE